MDVLLSNLIYQVFHFFDTLMLLILDFVGIVTNYSVYNSEFEDTLNIISCLPRYCDIIID